MSKATFKEWGKNAAQADVEQGPIIYVCSLFVGETDFILIDLLVQSLVIKALQLISRGY